MSGVREDDTSIEELSIGLIKSKKGHPTNLGDNMFIQVYCSCHLATSIPYPASPSHLSSPVGEYQLAKIVEQSYEMSKEGYGEVVPVDDS